MNPQRIALMALVLTVASSPTQAPGSAHTDGGGFGGEALLRASEAVVDLRQDEPGFVTAVLDWPEPDLGSLRPEDLESLWAPLWTRFGTPDLVGLRIAVLGRDGVERDIHAYLMPGEAPDKEDLLEPERAPEQNPEDRIVRGGARTGGAGPAAGITTEGSAPGRVQGALSGKTIYLSQCHGWLWYESLGRWSTQRGNLFDTVEDFHNPEGLNIYLRRMLHNMGAQVFTMREPGRGAPMVIVDNDGPGYSEESGAWYDSTLDGWANGNAPYPYGVNPFELGNNRLANVDGAGSARARFTPELPVSGLYDVYAAWSSFSGRASDARYTVHHAGGSTEIRMDQRNHGFTWVWLGEFFFEAGSDPVRGSVTVDNDSADLGANVSADAIRFGSGRGDVERNGSVSGYPRWEEGAIYYTQFAGAPASVYDIWSCDQNGDGVPDNDGCDPSSRAAFTNWEHPDSEDAVYLSWHSNAGGGQGTSTFVYGPCAPWEGCGFTGVEGSWELGALVQNELVDAITALWDPTWNDRGLHTAYFAEVNPRNNPETPAALIELAFHDLASDAALLKEPRFRRDASRAMARSVVRYFAERDGLTPTFPPEPPVGPALTNTGDGSLRLEWSDGPTGAPWGDAAEAWLVQTSPDGLAWDAGVEVTDNPTVLGPRPGGTVVAVRIMARNAGGLSLPSQVIAAAVSDDGPAEVLVVDGFERLDRFILPTEWVSSALGSLVRFDPDRSNPFRFSVIHTGDIAALGAAADGATAEALRSGAVDPGEYALLDWMLGEESSADLCFDPTEQQIVRDYLARGGVLFASGAEVLWQLDARGTTDDRAFAAEVFGALLESDDAGTYRVQAESGGWFEGLGEIDFDDGSGVTYDVEWPDVLAPEPGVEIDLRYPDGRAAGVRRADAPLTLLWGFPYETITDPDLRRAYLSRILARSLPSEGPRLSALPIPPTGEDPVPEEEQPAVEQPSCRCSSSGPSGARSVIFAAVALILPWRRRLQAQDP